MMNFLFNRKTTIHNEAQKIRDWMKNTMGVDCKTAFSTKKNILYDIL